MSQIYNIKDELKLLEEIEVVISVDSKPLIQQKAESEFKNRKWTEEEHVLYILFLEFNRNKIKSKLIRRSNSFYKEMAAFIKGKNGIQCRSHHQKYQARYKYPHKIIREEKEKLDQQLYNSIRQTLVLGSAISSSQTVADTEAKAQPIKIQRDYTNMTTVSCQTDIEGVDQLLLKPQHLYGYYNWISQMSTFHHARQAESLYNWCIPKAHYPMGTWFPDRPF